MKHTFISFIILCSLPSCDFETVMEVDVPAHKPRLVLNCILDADSAIVVDVTASRGILERDYVFESVENAQVKIHTDQQTWLLEHNGDGKYLLEEAVARIGLTYTVEVSAPSFTSVSSTTTIPVPVSIDRVEIGPIINRNGNTLRKLLIGFTDPPEKNYYQIDGWVDGKYYDPYRQDFVSFKQLVWFEEAKPGFQDFSQTPRLQVDDIFFNNRYHTLEVLIPEYLLMSPSESPVVLTLNLRSVHPDYQEYIKTKDLQNEVEGDPFAQPVQVFSNIQNGFGIFAGSSATQVVVEL